MNRLRPLQRPVCLCYRQNNTGHKHTVSAEHRISKRYNDGRYSDRWLDFSKAKIHDPCGDDCGIRRAYQDGGGERTAGVLQCSKTRTAHTHSDALRHLTLTGNTHVAPLGRFTTSECAPISSQTNKQHQSFLHNQSVSLQERQVRQCSGGGGGSFYLISARPTLKNVITSCSLVRG